MENNYKSLSDYYQSQAWAEKRTARLKIDGFKCAKCGFTRALEVHHINYERLGNEDVSRDLITLCKKCHNKIEAEKKTRDPIPKQAEHHSVYFAGPINMNDWRNRFCYYRGLPGDSEAITSGFQYKANDNITITGPFFISCDHGCYHGEGQHGMGAANGGCMGNYFTRNDVFNICKAQINRAEIVFAYICCKDCYGTIAEIGYAHAIGKDVIVIFSDTELKEEMWFVDQMQRNTGIASDKWIETQLTSKFQEDN